MSEEKLSSHKLDIEGAQRSSADEKAREPKESYRPISEDIDLPHGESRKHNDLLSVLMLPALSLVIGERSFSDFHSKCRLIIRNSFLLIRLFVPHTKKDLRHEKLRSSEIFC